MTRAVRGRAKAFRGKASKQAGKGSIKERPGPHQPGPKVPAAERPRSLAERLQVERAQIFKAISIVECCKNATATLIEMDDSEYMVPAFEAICDLLDASAEELERIVDECKEPSRSRKHGAE
jgi:hypothetical protein